MQDPTPPGHILQYNRGPLGERPDPADAPFVLERLAVLTHELNNLLDGSLRCLGLARRSLMGLPTHATEVHAARRQLDTVYGALERMADLVNAAMRGTSSVVGSPALSPKRVISLGEAATHAWDVVFPEAQEIGVSMQMDLAPDVAPLPIGPLYSVLLNGLRNALESIALAQRASPPPLAGRIEIVGRRRPLGSRRGAFDLVELDIRDDGAGLNILEDPSRAFSFGYSTKPGGLGVGLALAREVVTETGGTVELLPRDPAPPGGRPGAVLRICYPVPRDEHHGGHP
jgi:signal transduction histidine kinase